MSAAQSDFVSFLLERLEPLGGVSARRMFGGWGLFRGGAMFGLIADDVLYLKTAPVNETDFDAAAAPPFSYRRPSTDKVAVMKSFREIPAAVLADPEAFRQWCHVSSDAAVRAKSTG